MAYHVLKDIFMCDVWWYLNYDCNSLKSE